MLKTIINCETGKSEVVPMTDEEIAQVKADEAAAAQQAQQIEAAEAQRQADLEIVIEAAQGDPRLAALARLSGVLAPVKGHPPKPKKPGGGAANTTPPR